MDTFVLDDGKIKVLKRVMVDGEVVKRLEEVSDKKRGEEKDG